MEAENQVSGSAAALSSKLEGGFSSRTKSISALIALLGSLLAVVIPATTAIVEFYKTRRELAIESSKNAKELALKDKELEQNITMECLKLVVSKDTAASDRRQVLQAIVTIETPLQSWAKDRLEELDQAAAAADLRTAEIQQKFSTADRNSVKAVVASETVAVLEQKISRDRDNHDELNKDWQQLIALQASALESRSGDASVASHGSTAGDVKIGKGAAGNTEDAGKVLLTAKQVTVEEVATIFPPTALENIRRNLPLVLSALKQFRMMDRTMILVALATIRTEAPTFAPLSEKPDRFNTSSGGSPFDLYDHRMGNLGPPDGERFKGRGYLQMTGRTLYTSFSSSMNLGDALVVTPEKAADPMIAAQLLVLYMKHRELKIRPAAESGDFAAVRKTFNGGTQGLDLFRQAYALGDKALPR